jgi:KDO2-lipid IV(A) lauroyltransferase
MRLPKGPMVLARATGAPCHPVFITRDGWRRYRVTVMPEIGLPPRRRGDEAEVSALWAAPIYQMAKSHWNQWFVFEAVFSGEVPR